MELMKGLTLYLIRQAGIKKDRLLAPLLGRSLSLVYKKEN